MLAHDITPRIASRCTQRFATFVLAAASGVVAVAASCATSCAPPPSVSPAVPPVTSARPAESSTVEEPDGALSSAAPAASGGAPSLPYRGHGTESVAPELVEKYRARPLRPELARRIEALIDVRAPGIGQTSPDGSSLVFSWTITGVSQVWRLDGPRRFPVQLTGGEDSTNLAAITPDGKTLVLQRDRKGEENPGLYLQPANGGTLTPIQHVPGVQTLFEAVSSDSRYVYFASNDRKPDSYVIYRYDLVKKTKETVFDREEALWHVADMRDDGRLLLRKETGALTAEYYAWDPRKSELAPLLGIGEKEEYEARFGAREGELVVLTNKLGEYRRLYDWMGGELRPLGDAVSFDVDSFDIDLRRTRIVYTTNEAGYTRPHALDAKTLRPLPLPFIPSGVDHVTFGPTTPDGRFTTVGIDDGRHPVQGYVAEWAAGRLTAWHQPSAPEADVASFARARLETFLARDGTRVPVFVREPASCAAAPCPVVVSFHGGPEGQARPGFSVGAQIFVDAGFIFAEPNVRGSDGYGKTWLHADDGQKRLEIITDIEDAAHWARARFAVAGKAPKVGAYGGSYGGYSVLMAMTRFAGAYDAGVDVVGISDLRTFLRNTAPYRRVLRISEYGDPERDADALAKLSPMTYVDRAEAPLLIVQGVSDPRVPAGEAIQIHDALERKGVRCDLILFPDEGHGAQKRENRVLALGHAIEFLREHLDQDRPAE